MNPPIITLSLASTKQRILMLLSHDVIIGDVVAAAVIERLLQSPTGETTINNGGRSFFILGNWGLGHANGANRYESKAETKSLST